MDTKTHKFNHRILDHLNTGFNVYSPAIQWAIKNTLNERGDEVLIIPMINPAMLSFEYTINYKDATVTCEMFMAGIEGAVMSNTKKLPCTEGGPVVIESVMGTVRRIEEERPEQARIGAAAGVVQVLEDLCCQHLQYQIDKIKNRAYENNLWADRYQLTYKED
uniref:Uncharacterized protein n=1 Tax=Pseudomonas phage RVTF4 TaxID=3236931 RepID=A0AB39CD78_9VIRU